MFVRILDRSRLDDWPTRTGGLRDDCESWHRERLDRGMSTFHGLEEEQRSSQPCRHEFGRNPSMLFV